MGRKRLSHCLIVTVLLVMMFALRSTIYDLRSIQVRALEGVGALTSQVSSGTLVVISGRHAPRAEIVVAEAGSGSDPTGDDVIAAAIDDGTGNFEFEFNVSASQANSMEIFAIDRAGLTRRIAVPSSGLSNELLPPTLVQDPLVDLGADGVGLGGYSYPGATVQVVMNGPGGLTQTDEVETEGDGGYRVAYDGLSPGSYTVTATSRFGPLVSEVSYTHEFEILSAGEAVVVEVGDAVAESVRRLFPKAVTEVAEDVGGGAEVVNQVVAPVVGTGLVTQFLLIGREIFYWLVQLVISLMQLLGLRKKRNPWGVVYDSVTKNPIQWAIVRLYAVESRGGGQYVAGGQQADTVTMNKLVATDVTSKSGIFSFFPEAGTYLMKVARTGYEFPSKLVGGREDGEYTRVYHGEPVVFESEDAIVDVAVPLDPEKAKVGLWFKIVREVRKRVKTLTITSLVIGWIMALVSVLGGRAGFNAIMLVFYSIVLAVQVYLIYKKQKSWGVVVDRKGEGMEGVKLELVDAVFKRLVQRRVTNAEGKYQFVVPEGRYLIRIASLGREMVKGVKGAYQGEEIVVEGEKPKLIALKIVAKKPEIGS